MKINECTTKYQSLSKKQWQVILCVLYKDYIHFHNHYKFFHFYQYFHYILQRIYQLVSFYTYNFNNLNILQHHMIYHIHIHITITRIVFTFTLHSRLHLSLFQSCLLLQTLRSRLHLHLKVSCHFMCLASLVLTICFSTFMVLTKSGTYNFADGSLILL